MGKHNIVIACLPAGEMGACAAARASTHMAHAYPQLRFGLLVGTAGGIPSKVRLGEVVVSTPVGRYSGVVQWDFGKANSGGRFERTGALNSSPVLLRSALSKLRTANDMYGSRIPGLSERPRPEMARPGAAVYLVGAPARLCAPMSGAVDQSGSTATAVATKAHQRKEEDMLMHCGLIGSGNTDIRDARLRDQLCERFEGQLLCVEMEAAGLMDSFPCLVVSGICHYADGGEGEGWQEYAAARAAGFAKELLHHVQPVAMDQQYAAREFLASLSAASYLLSHVQNAKKRNDHEL